MARLWLNLTGWCKTRAFASPKDLGSFMCTDSDCVPVTALAQRQDNLSTAVMASEVVMLRQDNTEVVGTTTFKQTDKMSHETGPL